MILGGEWDKNWVPEINVIRFWPMWGKPSSSDAVSINSFIKTAAGNQGFWAPDMKVFVMRSPRLFQSLSGCVLNLWNTFLITQFPLETQMILLSSVFRSRTHLFSSRLIFHRKNHDRLVFSLWVIVEVWQMIYFVPKKLSYHSWVWTLSERIPWKSPLESYVAHNFKQRSDAASPSRGRWLQQ